jgi:hypothetical protein
MKYILITLSICWLGANAQTGNENFGSNAGNAGTQNSSFGYYAGDLVTGSYNSFFGAFSGLKTTSGTYNAMFGAYAGQYNTTGNSHVFVGYGAGASNTTGSENTYVGRAAGFAGTTSAANVFVGYYAGRFNLASQNTGMGHMALVYNTYGANNVATGFQALYSNTTGSSNVASGYKALYSNVSGSENTALGQSALYNNVAGYNTAVGSSALYANTTGTGNSATGQQAMYANTTGSSNTADGVYALGSNTTGSYNTAIGYAALAGNITGSYNTGVGHLAGPYLASNLTNTTALGANARTTASNMVKVGDSFVNTIGGSVAWSVISDGRFKRDVKEDITGLAFINELRPVSYIFDRVALDEFLGGPKNSSRSSTGNEVRQTGFIAQEVEAIIKRTGYVFDGVEAPESEFDNYRIRYAQFVVPLVKAVQELSTKLEDQEKDINANEKEIEGLMVKLNSISANRTLAMGMFLSQNYPNPFDANSEIRVTLPQKTIRASLVVFDENGVPVKTYPIQDRGDTVVTLASGDFKKGVYMYSLIADGIVIDTKRMVIEE